MQFFTGKTRGCNILFNFANKKMLSFLSVHVIRCQETPVVVKKDVLPPFVSVNALLFSMQYGHFSFPCVLQPETIS
jgi:membrane protein CcdC involved in cytochrome C biogenesis